MNLSRSLFAVPVLIIAAATAAACSSSSSPAGTTGEDGGQTGTSSTSKSTTANTATSGGNGGTACAQLLACCAQLTGPNVTSCEGTASAGNAANCASELAMAVAANACNVTSSSGGSTTVIGGSSTGNSGLSQGSNPGSTSGASNTTSGGSATGSSGAPGADAGAGTCANPPTTTPVGFAVPTGIIGTGCTSAEVQAYASCAAGPAQSNDPGCYNPFLEGAPDGQVNACGQCVQGTQIAPNTNTSAAWGLNIIIGFQPSIGDTDPEDLVVLNLGPEPGVCLYAAGGTAAHACALDTMAVDDCIYSICDNVCAIPNPGTGMLNSAAVQALENCWSTVQNGACAQYIEKLHTDCKAYTQLGATELSTYNKCYQLIDQTYNVPQEEQTPGTLTYPEAGPGTATGEAQLLELACGGGDAGF